MTSYSRSNPSPRFRLLEELYTQVHQEGVKGHAPEKVFDGHSLRSHIPAIKHIAARSGAKSILDYGSGKALHYKNTSNILGDGSMIGSIADYWNVDCVHCYDPGVAEFSQLPRGTFDGVISTDVLEHIPEEDIPWLLREIFSFADRFVYLNIAGYPASKHLPNGWNAHVTIRPVNWWKNEIMSASAGWRGMHLMAVYEHRPISVVRNIRKALGKSRFVKRIILDK